MSESAFGVDHGEFSKAGLHASTPKFRMPGSFKPKMPNLKKMPGMQGAGARRAPGMPNVNPGGAGGARKAPVPGMANRAKTAMQTPGAKIAGAGAAGVAGGAGASSMMNRKRQF